MTQFRSKYRRAEVLIVDDIQFLKGKEKTGDEFFHTFNALLELQAQIILTSRTACFRDSKLGSSTQNTLRKRPDGGFGAASLGDAGRYFAKEDGGVAGAALSGNPPLYRGTSAHERAELVLEGALVRVATFSSLGTGGLTLERVEALLKDIFHQEASHKVSIDSIQRTVADYYDLRIADMTGRRRPKKIAHARQVAMYLSRKLTKSSLMEIGDAFGGRDHGTIIHAVKKVTSLVESGTRYEGSGGSLGLTT